MIVILAFTLAGSLVAIASQVSIIRQRRRDRQTMKRRWESIR